jgi:tripartite-type tricarboxylate transporter receptor subunit TctC
MQKYLVTMLSFAAAVVATGAQAQDAGDFFKDKSMTMLIGSDAGGGYDLAGRLIAQHLSRFVPGHPVFVPRNMPGASSVRAAEWFANVAPKDGTVVGMFQPTIITNKLMDKAARYEPEKFGWLGRLSSAPQFGLVRTDAPATTLEEAKQKEIIFSANSPTGTGAQVPWALNRLIGTKFKVVRGYTSAVATGLAVERNEANGLGSTSWEYLDTKPEWLKEKKVNILYSIGLTRDPRIPDVPTIVELGKTDEDKAVLKLLAVAATVGRSPALTPGVPADRLAFMRDAYDKMMADPQFQADAKKRQIELDPAKGAEIASDVADIVGVPESVMKRLQDVTQPID